MPADDSGRVIGKIVYICRKIFFMTFEWRGANTSAPFFCLYLPFITYLFSLIKGCLGTLLFFVYLPT